MLLPVTITSDTVLPFAMIWCLLERLDLESESGGWLDAGDLAASPLSPLVSVRERPVRIVREGAIPSAEVWRILE